MRSTTAVAAALAVVVSAPLAAAAAPAPAAARKKIAVLDVRAVQGVAPGTATILTAIVADEAARGGYDVISQADVAAMIGFERQRRMLGCGDDSSCLAEIGGALGVEYVLTGQVGQIGTRFHLAFQLIDARRARIVTRASRFSDQTEDALAAAAQGTVNDLLAAVRAGAFVAGARPGDAVPLPPPPALARPRPDLAARAAPAPALPPSVDARRGTRTAAWITLGGGVALLAGGALLGLQARQDHDAIARAWADPAYASIYDARNRASRREALLSNVCWAGGGVATAVSGWLFWRSRTPPRVSVAPAVDPDGRLAVAVRGSF